MRQVCWVTFGAQLLYFVSLRCVVRCFVGADNTNKFFKLGKTWWKKDKSSFCWPTSWQSSRVVSFLEQHVKGLWYRRQQQQQHWKSKGGALASQALLCNTPLFALPIFFLKKAEIWTFSFYLLLDKSTGDGVFIGTSSSSIFPFCHTKVKTNSRLYLASAVSAPLAWSSW